MGTTGGVLIIGQVKCLYVIVEGYINLYNPFDADTWEWANELFVRCLIKNCVKQKKTFLTDFPVL